VAIQLLSRVSRSDARTYNRTYVRLGRGGAGAGSTPDREGGQAAEERPATEPPAAEDAPDTEQDGVPATEPQEEKQAATLERLIELLEGEGAARFAIELSWDRTRSLTALRIAIAYEILFGQDDPDTLQE
jgi:hypothetical protein